jgi:hypothetical protein
MLHSVVSWKLTDVSEMLVASIIMAIIALMMEAVNTSETSFKFYEIKCRKIPEESNFHKDI